LRGGHAQIKEIERDDDSKIKRWGDVIERAGLEKQ
jgi:hypothetical protein